MTLIEVRFPDRTMHATDLQSPTVRLIVFRAFPHRIPADDKFDRGEGQDMKSSSRDPRLQNLDHLISCIRLNEFKTK